MEQQQIDYRAAAEQLSAALEQRNATCLHQADRIRALEGELDRRAGQINQLSAARKALQAQVMELQAEGGVKDAIARDIARGNGGEG